MTRTEKKIPFKPEGNCDCSWCKPRLANAIARKKRFKKYFEDAKMRGMQQ